MNLTELLRMRGFDLSQKVKIVRHQDKNCDVNLLYKNNWIEFYQSIQSKERFKDCDYILSFLGTEGTKAVFIGAYHKVGVSSFDNEMAPKGFPYEKMLEKDMYYYHLEVVDILSDLKDRLVIDWGKSTINWCQWLREDKPKQVVEILPDGYVKEFPGFDELILSFGELEKIIKFPDANRQWQIMLSSVAGIYLIVDTNDGSQYVGSAYGGKGILGRWRNYIDTYHGGNKGLVKILEQDKERYNDFQFSILRTLPKSLTNDQVIAYEQLYKRKLGTRTFGLNEN